MARTVRRTASHIDSTPQRRPRYADSRAAARRLAAAIITDEASQ